MNVKLLLSVYRGPHPLSLPHWVACSRLLLLVSPSPAFPLTLTYKLCQLLVYPQVELHGHQVITDVEGNTPSTYPLPVFPEEFLPFNSYIPVVGAT